MMLCVKTRRQPSRAEIEKQASRNPDYINALFAYFVMEWEDILPGTQPLHGRNQCGVIQLVPNYVLIHGLDACIAALRHSPQVRSLHGPGGLTIWLNAIP